MLKVNLMSECDHEGVSIPLDNASSVPQKNAVLSVRAGVQLQGRRGFCPWCAGSVLCEVSWLVCWELRGSGKADGGCGSRNSTAAPSSQGMSAGCTGQHRGAWLHSAG